MQHREEFELLRWRIGILGYVLAAAFTALGFGFWRHQIVDANYYEERADKNRIQNIPLIAPRGRIYDRYHRLLADNRPSYNVVLIRENSPHTVEETATALAPGLGVPIQELLERINRKRREPAFRPIVLKEDVDVADIAFVRARQFELPEVRVENQPRRRYLGNELAAHVLGYLGEVSEAELATPAYEGYNPGDQTGRTGLERTYNSLLRGKDGFKNIVVNTMGKEVSQLERKPFRAGADLQTTIDIDLQRAAEEGIGARTGAVVVLDPRAGEILAIVSKPSFDANVFATRISSADWNRLNGDPRKPLQNRAIQNSYAPGSVFKIWEAAAALEANLLDPLETVYCPGSATINGHTYGCWKKGGHGTVDLYEAIVNSCDVYFYNLGRTMGISRISEFSNLMGLGRRTGIELPGEVPGLIPSEEWSWRVRKAKWYSGETISLAIGQGAIGVTPLQAAWAMGGLASGGRLVQPRLVTAETLEALGLPAPDIKTETYTMRQSTVDIVSKAMWGVVNEGTGTQARVPGFDVAGKTGTSQVVGKEHYGKGAQFEDHAWFVGFAPYRNPEIVVAVFIENGGHGGDAAAPVARAVFEEYYKKRNAPTGEKPPAIAALSN